MSVRGIGNDILRHSRLAGLVARPQRLARFARRVLHPKHELPRLQRILAEQSTNANNSAETQAVRLLASTWCAKEAMYKSLDPADQTGFKFNQWYRSAGDDGPRQLLSDEPWKQERFLLTISHDGEYTSAFVMRVS